MARTVHHVEHFQDAELAACQERSIRQAALCFTVSETGRRDVAAGFGVESVVVGNGVDLRRFQTVEGARLDAWRARLGEAAGRPVVLAVGGVEPRKNTQRILLAFARFRAVHPRAHLWILGGATVLDHGAYRTAWEASLSELPAETRQAVVELGVVPDDDLPALFRLADVLALPSLQEGFGLAALEALAAGLPVVAADRPPFTEFLDGSCATLVDPESTDQIADGLTRALQAAPRQSRAGRRRARAHSWARVASLHAPHYERTMTHAADALRRSLA
jgi:glycosyltransferase-like protein